MTNVNLLVHQLKGRMDKGEAVTQQDLELAQHVASATSSTGDRALYAKVKMLLQAQADADKPKEKPVEVPIVTKEQVDAAFAKAHQTRLVKDRIEFSRLSAAYQHQQQDAKQ